jgi:hypothetical protein
VSKNELPPAPPSPPAIPTNLGDIPAYAAALVMLSSAQAFQLSAYNAAISQIAGASILNASTAVGVARILGMTKSEEKELFELLQATDGLPNG